MTFLICAAVILMIVWICVSAIYCCIVASRADKREQRMYETYRMELEGDADE